MLFYKIVFFLLVLKFSFSSGNTGRFIMFYMMTNIYNKKSKGPNLMEFFTATEKNEKFH
jgi:hypothetical protein